MESAPPATRFAAIIDGLCRAVAARGAKGAFGTAKSALVLLLWTRLRRAATRFATLAAGAAGPETRRKTARDPRKPCPRSPDLPRRRGWILAPVPEAAAFAGQLRDLLADPEFRKLVEAGGAKNRFGRILRPLCRTIGLKPPPFLRLPKPAEQKKRRKANRGGAGKPKFMASLVVSGPFHPPFQPPGTIPPRRTRSPPRPA